MEWEQRIYSDFIFYPFTVESCPANKETRECGDSTSAGVEMVSASFVGHLGNLLLVI